MILADDKRLYPSNEDEQINIVENNEDSYTEYDNTVKINKEVLDEKDEISVNESNDSVSSSKEDKPFIEDEMDIEVPFIPYTKDFIPKGVDKQKLIKEANKEKKRQELLKEIEEMQREAKAKKDKEKEEKEEIEEKDEQMNIVENNEDSYTEYDNTVKINKEVLDEKDEISVNESNDSVSSSKEDKPFIEDEMDIEVPFIPYTKDFIPKGVDKQKLIKEANKEKKRQELLKEIEEMQREAKAKKDKEKEEKEEIEEKDEEMKKNKDKKKKGSSKVRLIVLVSILVIVSSVFVVKKIGVPDKLGSILDNNPIAQMVSQILNKNELTPNPSTNFPEDDLTDSGTDVEETGDTTNDFEEVEEINPDLVLLNMVKAKLAYEKPEDFEYEVSGVHIEEEKISVDIQMTNSSDMYHLNRMVQEIQKILLEFAKSETKFIEVNLSVGNATLTWNTPEKVIKFINDLSFHDRHSSQFWWDMTDVYKNSIYYKNSIERQKLYVNSPHPVWNIEEEVEEEDKQISLLAWNNEYESQEHNFRMYYPDTYVKITDSTLLNYKYVKFVPAYNDEAHYISSMDLFLYDSFYVGSPLRRLDDYEKANRERISFSSILNANHKIDYGIFKETSSNGKVTYIYYFVGNSSLGDYDLIVKLTEEASANLDKAITNNLSSNISRIDFALNLEDIGDIENPDMDDDNTGYDVDYTDDDMTDGDIFELNDFKIDEDEKNLNLPDLSKFAEEKEEEDKIFKIGN